ncbi:MAG TPA: zf-HC2 domain-containing protein [Gemmatimonadaceae bacterium]|nr:zf-HC2 domain-containing protein [Gemmatimonadaceae bacterium]
MTTNVMTCADFSDRLTAYLERETDDTTRAALERHAVTCVKCGALLADLRKLRIDAANLPELAPSRDLWSGIEKRIETPVVPITGEFPVATAPARRAPVRRWVRPALMAAALVGAAVLGYFGGARRPPVGAGATTIAERPQTTPAAVAPETAVVPTPPSVTVASTVPSTSPAGGGTPVQTVAAPAAAAPTTAVQATNRLVADYDREIGKLRVLIDQRRNQMDPVTVAVIERNLQVIDAAIAECKKAIARDPASRFLIESLNQSLQAKVELMRTAALLPSRT